MITASYHINGHKVKYYFEQSIKGIDSFSSKALTVLITDAQVHAAYTSFFEGRKVIVLPVGEAAKTLESIAKVIQELVDMQVHKGYLLVGMGGGVVTDVTGFVASIYMRGLPFAYMPTSLLAMVDAAIGGKNGINYGNHKNMIGTIRQPNWIIFDRTMLYTLPHSEWVNGFAEVIKYGVVLHQSLFTLLQQHTIHDFKHKHYLTAKLLYICTHIKSLIVEQDEQDNGQRRLLNFGHTCGHAIEKLEHIPHGYAIAKGMHIALKLSEEMYNLPTTHKQAILDLLTKYELPTAITSNVQDMLNLIQLDKKRADNHINFILLSSKGQASVVPISLLQLNDLFNQIV